MLFHRILPIWIFAYTAGSTDKQRRRWQPKCKYIKQKRPTTVWYCLAEKNNANASLGNTMFIVCSRQNYCYREFGRYIGQQNLITCGISNSGCLCIDATNTRFFVAKLIDRLGATVIGLSTSILVTLKRKRFRTSSLSQTHFVNLDLREIERNISELGQKQFP